MKWTNFAHETGSLVICYSFLTLFSVSFQQRSQKTIPFQSNCWYEQICDNLLLKTRREDVLVRRFGSNEHYLTRNHRVYESAKVWKWFIYYYYSYFSKWLCQCHHGYIDEAQYRNDRQHIWQSFSFTYSFRSDIVQFVVGVKHRTDNVWWV